MFPRVFSVSDQALTVELGNQISETTHHTVLALETVLLHNPFPGLLDIVPAYCSLTVFYNAESVRKAFPTYPTAFAALEARLNACLHDIDITELYNEDRTIRIPVCYSSSFGWDWQEVCEHTHLPAQEVIRLHTTATYRVYMMGFLPGFPYLGGLPLPIAVPRKAQPRIHVPAGSVGIGGPQTGVYPLSSPGGWQLIGRTPLPLFDKNAKNPVLLRTGDTVVFFAIDEYEFYQLYREPSHS